MRNNSQMTYTSINIRNSKFLLISGMAAAVVIDALITILLCIGGYSFKFIAFPAVLFLLDVVYLIVGSTATNYRFKYSIAVWLLYVLFTCAACISGTVILLKLDGTVLTDFALILWAAVHAVSIICAIFTALYTSKKVKSVVFTTVVTLLLALACAFYAVFLFTRGFFGQGYGLRTLVYDYDASTDSYVVSGVLSGNSQKVEVGDTFNGKPVTAINCDLFTNDSIKEYVLHDNFELLNTHKLSNGNFEGKSVLVDSEDATAFRAKLFGCANTLYSPANILTLANATLPCNLEEGKGYIAFDYDENAFIACGGKIMPLIIGDNGQTVSLSDYALTYNYLNHTDKTDVADLKWGYENCNGYILENISSNSSYVVDDGVKVEVKFEKVYQVYVQSGNDTKYDLRAKQADFCCDKLNGTALDYRYLAKSNADTFFNNFNQREGFSLVWKYGEGSIADNSLGTIAEAFENIEGSTLTLCPEWTLNNPTVELQSNYTITYGENVTFTSQATSPATGVSLVYEWKHNSAKVGTSKDLTLTTPSLSGGYDGTYELTVTTNGGEVTSLTSSAIRSLSLAINKKIISFGWDMPEENDRVYSGTAKAVTATFDNSQLVGSDSIEYKLSGFTSATANCVDAGSYSFAVEIDSTSASNYQLNSTSTNSLTITPLPVAVSWSNTNLTYNGLTQKPTASALGVSGQQLVSSVSGGQKNAGENYPATAYCSDGNYTLTNNTSGYTIAKAPLTVTAKNCTAVYGDNPVGNSADYSGFVNNETASVLGGLITYNFTNHSNNVGTYVGCVEIFGLTSNNYEISYVFGNLEITKAPLKVVAVDCTAVYGNELKFNRADYFGFKYNETPSVLGGTLSHAFTNTSNDVGTYKNCVIISGLTSDNYEISYENGNLEITPRPVTLSWSGYENLVYDGQAKNVTATINNVVASDIVYAIITGGNAIGAGPHTATASLAGTKAGNYYLEENSFDYTIAKAEITLKAENATSVYGQSIVQLIVNTTGTIYYEDIISFSVTTTATPSSPVGTYPITVEADTQINYDITVWNATYTITQATPTLNGFTENNFNLSGYLEYGTTLGEITAQLPAQNLGGSWVWADGDKKVADVGTNTYALTFNPTDSHNYKSVTASVTVSVKKSPEMYAAFSGEGVTITDNNEYEVLLNNGWAPVTVTIYAEGLDENRLSVIFKKDGQTLTDLELTDGVVTFTQSGKYQVIIAYGGDETHLTGSVSYTITVMAAEGPVVTQ